MDIQKIKDARNKGVVAFSRYCQEKRRYPNCLFCFFEGEDAKYYNPRIEKYTDYKYDEIVSYNCGGKKGVLCALRMIDKDENDNYKRAFFIDSDYDVQQYDIPNLYQTPCYSIENFYVSETAFKKMLNREFGINVVEDDFIKACSDYAKRLKEFHDKTLFVNAWLACQRLYEEKEECKVMLSKFRVSKFFSEISIEKVVCEQEINEEMLKEIFPKSRMTKDLDIDEKINFFIKGDCSKLFRGKFELEFLKKIIDSLKMKNKSGDYFLKNYTSVNIDPNVNTLSALTEYADTPICLIDFLKKYRTA